MILIIKKYFFKIIDILIFVIKSLFIIYFVFFCIDNDQDVTIFLPFLKYKFKTKLFIIVITAMLFSIIMAIIVNVVTRLSLFLNKIKNL